MPTKQRLQARLAADQIIDLQEAATRSGYASETLRKMMWAPNPPPMYKFRGRWRVRSGEFDAWLAQRDGGAA